MSETLNFTKAVLEKLPSQEKVYEVSDAKIRGLRLLIFPSGTKVFYLLRRNKDKVQKIKIGRLNDLSMEEVRDEANRLNSLITLGYDPHKQKQDARKELTFKELSDNYYYEHLLPFTKRPRDNLKMLEFHVLPKIGRMRKSEIDKETISKLHRDIGENRGKIGANRVLRIVSAIFNHAINKERTLYNPCKGLKMFKETSRDRFLYKHELKAFFDALKEEEQIYQDFFTILLFTGARKTNVLTMQILEIDFENKIWRLDERVSKNGENNFVYLNDLCINILNRRRKINQESITPSKYMFPGQGKMGHLIDPKKSFMRIKKRMGITDFHIHDLRRTLGSYMAISGASLPVIGKALNHKSADSTQIYARLNQSTVVKAIETAAAFMKAG